MWNGAAYVAVDPEEDAAAPLDPEEDDAPLAPNLNRAIPGPLPPAPDAPARGPAGDDARRAARRLRDQRNQARQRRRAAARAPAAGPPHVAAARAFGREAVARADAANAAAADRADDGAPPCRYFAQGQRCPWGQACRYAHVPIDPGSDSEEPGDEPDGKADAKELEAFIAPTVQAPDPAGPPYTVRARPTPNRLAWCAHHLPSMPLRWVGGSLDHPLLASTRVYLETRAGQMARDFLAEHESPNAWVATRGVSRRRIQRLNIANHWMCNEVKSEVDELREQDFAFPYPNSCRHDPLACDCHEYGAVILSNQYCYNAHDIMQMVSRTTARRVFWIGHIFDGVGRFNVVDGVAEAHYHVDVDGVVHHQVANQQPYRDPANGWLRQFRHVEDGRAMVWKVRDSVAGFYLLEFSPSQDYSPVIIPPLTSFLTQDIVGDVHAGATDGIARAYAAGRTLMIWPQGAKSGEPPVQIPRELLRILCSEASGLARDASRHALLVQVAKRWTIRNPSPLYNDPLVIEWAATLAISAGAREAVAAHRANIMPNRFAIARANRHLLAQYAWRDYVPWFDKVEDWFARNHFALFSAAVVALLAILAVGFSFPMVFGPACEEAVAHVAGAHVRIGIAVAEIYYQKSAMPLAGHGILAYMQRRLGFWTLPAHYALNALGFNFNVFHVLGDYADAFPSYVAAAGYATYNAASSYAPDARTISAAAAYMESLQTKATVLALAATERAQQVLSSKLGELRAAAERRIREAEEAEKREAPPTNSVHEMHDAPATHWTGAQRDYQYKGPDPKIDSRDTYVDGIPSAKKIRGTLRPAGIVNPQRRPVVPASTLDNEDAAVRGRLLQPRFPVARRDVRAFGRAVKTILSQGRASLNATHIRRGNPVVPTRPRWTLWNSRFPKAVQLANNRGKEDNWLRFDMRRITQHQMFVKIEKLTKMIATAVAAFFPRAIESCHATFNAMTGPWFYGFGEWAKLAWNKSSQFFMLSGCLTEDVAWWLDRARDFVGNVTFVDVDRSRWDARVSWPLIREAYIHVRSILAMPRRAYRAVVKAFRKHTGTTKHLAYYKTTGRIITGFPGTSVGNSLFSNAASHANFTRCTTRQQRAQQKRFFATDGYRGRLWWLCCGVGDDLVCIHDVAVPYDAMMEQRFGFEPKVNVTFDPAEVTVLSGRFYSTEPYFHEGRILTRCLAGKLGRQATKFGWDITPFDSRAALLRANASARLVDWCHVPVLRKLAAVSYNLSSPVYPNECPRSLRMRMETSTLHNPVDLTFEEVANIYGVSSAIIRSLECHIQTIEQLPHFLRGAAASLFSHMADVDA